MSDTSSMMPLMRWRAPTCWARPGSVTSRPPPPWRLPARRHRAPPAGGQRLFHFHAGGVHGLAHARSLFSGHLAHGSQIPGQRAGLAQHCHAHRLERRRRVRRGDFGQGALAQRRQLLCDCHKVRPFFLSQQKKSLLTRPAWRPLQLTRNPRTGEGSRGTTSVGNAPAHPLGGDAARARLFALCDGGAAPPAVASPWVLAFGNAAPERNKTHSRGSGLSQPVKPFSGDRDARPLSSSSHVTPQYSALRGWSRRRTFRSRQTGSGPRARESRREAGSDEPRRSAAFSSAAGAPHRESST